MLNLISIREPGVRKAFTNTSIWEFWHIVEFYD